MSSVNLFKSLGLLVIPGFFGADSCAQLRDAVRRANATEATVYDGDDEEKLKQDVRRTLRAHVRADAADFVRHHLTAIQPTLVEHFKTELSAFREPQFLVYRAGDFFSAHRDASPDDPPNVRIRKVSLVIFLNSERAEPGADSFSGGSLVFYDLFDDPRLRKRGVPLHGEEGLLVAFPSDRVHRVSPVSGGERHTIVTWFT